MMNCSSKKLAFCIKSAKKSFGPTKALCVEQTEDNPLCIYRGSTTAIIGLSGSGKSTLLSLLGLLDESDGDTHISYYSTDSQEPLEYSNLKNNTKIKLKNTKFGFAFQDGHLIGHISVNSNIKLPISLAGTSLKVSNEISNKLASNLGLSQRFSARPKELSGGEYQRVAIARSMAHNPEVIFSDEPTGNLDTDTGKLVMDMLSAWRMNSDNNTLILVTHDIQQAYIYADQFIILENGSVKCFFSKNELDTPGEFEWKKKIGVSNSVTGLDVLLQLFKANSCDPGKNQYPEWDKKTYNLRKYGYLFWYGFRDLFPIRLFPFNLSIFLTTLRDTIFTLLTILSVGMLISVLIIGYGIFHGVQKYQGTNQKNDIRANRLIVEIDASSTLSEIDEALLFSLRNELKNVKIKDSFFNYLYKKLLFSKNINEQAVKGIYGFSNSELFIFKSTTSSKMFGAIGSTIQVDSPLHDRLTYKGKKLPRKLITDYETEGIIFKSSWLRRILELKEDDKLPDSVLIQYGHSGIGITSKERLKLLGVVDDLPDGVFLMSPGCWHKIRDRKWRPNYKTARIIVSSNVTLNDIPKEIESAIKLYSKRATVFTQKAGNGDYYINIDCGYVSGWKKKYWENTIYKDKIKPLLEKNQIMDKTTFKLIAKTDGLDSLSSRLSYTNAAVYLSEIGAVEKVASLIREKKLSVDKYLVDLYKSKYQTTQLFILIFGVIAVCALFLSTVNIFLMFYQTVLRKRHEIGILKAFGCSSLRIANIFFIESLYISFIAAFIGLMTSYYSGNFISNILMNIYELSKDYGTLFYLDGKIVTIIVLFVFIMCEFITYIATYKTSAKTSNELLRQRD